LAKAERFRRDALPLLSGAAPRDGLLRGTPLYDAARLVSAFTEPSARILLFQEVRGYFLDRDYVWGDPLNQDVLAYRRFPDPEQLRLALRQSGIGYVLVGRESFPFDVEKRFAAADWDAMAKFLAVAQPVFATEHYVLYAVDRPPLDPGARLTPAARAPLLEGGVLDGSVAVDASSGYPLCRAP
jgi:hypothetical protein